MGQSACKCLNAKESNNLQITKIEKKSLNLNKPNHNFDASKVDMKLYMKNIKKIIKLQSYARGYITRKKNASLLKQYRSEHQNAPGEGMGYRPIDKIPDYSNESIRATEARIGQFKYDKQESESDRDLIERGPFELDNQAVYVGQWNKMGLRHGRGLQIWPDGSKYEGYWKNDTANGKGRLIHADGDVYEGNWVNDKANGKGTYIHVDGAKYIGEWIDDKQHGQGKETWPDGSFFEGTYDNGKKHGKGKFCWDDGSTYDGEFYLNNIQGFGIYHWSDGRIHSGYWKNNKMEGKGTFTWADGRKYVGDYIDDKKHGYGEFIWPDGRKYIGHWENGKQNGMGVYISVDGKKREGEWKDGKRVRWVGNEKNDSPGPVDNNEGKNEHKNE